MATWITHLMIADGVMAQCPALDRRGFCVGNIAPDCNIENEDWSAFTPSREVTHWMSGARKVASDCEAFCAEYILKRGAERFPAEEYAFLLGYYSHLLTDAAFQKFIRDEARVKAVWERIKAHPVLRDRARGLREDWDTVKKLIPKDVRMGEIYSLEAEYLQDHPDSGYLTEVLQLEAFPDYIDYLPTGCIVRKIGVMGYLPKPGGEQDSLISISKEEFKAFVADTTGLVLCKLEENGLAAWGLAKEEMPCC